jgi:hypothetical protein
MSKIPTAEDFMNSEQYEPDKGICFEDYHGDNVAIVPDMMIEFAKLHVEAALKAAASNARIIDDPNSYTGNTGSEYPADQMVDRKAILNSYLPTNIK